MHSGTFPQAISGMLAKMQILYFTKNVGYMSLMHWLPISSINSIV